MTLKQGKTAVAGAGPGHEIETTIERIVSGGEGLAHGLGRTLFVPLSAPGDRVRVRLERVRGAIGFARIVELLAPSPDRVPPPYPALTDCGGCDFQHLAYEAQLAAKVAIVRDCLRRIGRLEPPADVPIVPSPRPWGYRGRAEWRHDPESGTLGYVESGSHRVCDLAHDPLVEPALDAALGELRGGLAAGTLPADVGEFRAAAGDGAVSLAPSLDGDEPAAVVRNVAGERYAFDADCFFQANPGLLAPLVAEALRFAPDGGSGGSERGPAIDLYCGVGLFTVPLARRVPRVIGVESHPRTAAFAARNAQAADLPHVRIETMAVERWLADRWRSFGRAPFLLVDPPRAGLDPATLRGILRLRPDRVAYVSCDPATLARDLRALLRGGYRLERVVALDMFPQTHHVEVVAHLARDT
jgi:23S rRNA (uracil1939-C5)-methyltransferase